MTHPALHRFGQGGRKFVVDPETCFCFECDDISWEVIGRYPHTPLNRIYHELEGRFDRTELEEVTGELEWLRACKSILPAANHETMKNAFTLERGVRLLTMELPPTSEPGADIQRAAILLLTRAGEQKELRLLIRTELGDAVKHAGTLAAACAGALRLGGLSGKTLAVEFAVAMPAETIGGHLLRLGIEIGADADGAAALKAVGRGKLAKVVQAVAALGGVRITAQLQPGNADFAPAAAELLKAGFDDITLDLDGAYVATPGLVPEDMLEGLRAVADQYAQDLLKGRYYRLEPVAGLFKRIYDGTPLRRADGIGVNELALDAAGGIYPSAHLLGQEEFRAGNLGAGEIDEEALAKWDDVGVLTTPVCVHCWARHFCGGGTAAVHHALSGNARRPAEAWCAAQRDWVAAAISAFNVLSAKGVNFTRIHAGLGRKAGKASWLGLARAAFTMQLGIRNIEEGDAEWLQQWENWNPAAYFTLHESGMLMATRYDREMDALHPPAYEHEFVIVRRDGNPCGLLRVRPERREGLATIWVYFRDPADYASAGVRKSFRALLEEAGKQQAIRTVLTPAGPFDEGLGEFLAATGFEKAGVQRDGLFLHGKHHGVAQYSLAL